MEGLLKKLHINEEHEIAETGFGQSTGLQLIHTDTAFEKIKDRKKFYARFESHDAFYGPYFKIIDEVYQKKNENHYCLKIQPRESVLCSVSRYGLHPTLMDACFQSMILALAKGEKWQDYKIDNIQYIDFLNKPSPDEKLWICARWAQPIENGALMVDIKLQNEAGDTFCLIKRLKLVKTNPALSMQQNAPFDNSAPSKQMSNEKPQYKKPNTEDALTSLVAELVKIPKSKIKRSEPFKNLGVDSLMAITLKNKIEAAFAINIQPTAIWSYPNCAELADFIASKLPIDEHTAEENDDHLLTSPNKQVPEEEIIGQMSDMEMLEELEKELNEINC
jgi:acyl carrier protein